LRSAFRIGAIPVMHRCHALVLALTAGMSAAQCPSADFRDPEPPASAAPTQIAPLAPIPAPFPAMRSPIILPFNASERVYLPIQQAVSDEELTARVGCPHLSPGLQHWHDPSTWANGVVPTTSGMDVTLPPNAKVIISSCSIPPGVVFGYIHVPETTSLVFAVRCGSSAWFYDAAVAEAPCPTFFAGRQHHAQRPRYHGARQCELADGLRDVPPALLHHPHILRHAPAAHRHTGQRGVGKGHLLRGAEGGTRSEFWTHIFEMKVLVEI